jgi:iron-sulfur cluster assembly protein
MLFVSEEAKTKILDLFEKEKRSEESFVRVSVTSGGCSGLTYMMEFDDQSRPDDQVFEDKGIRIVTDVRSVLYLFNTTLDFSGGLDGKGFHFVNPNATRTCACGESFSV